MDTTSPLHIEGTISQQRSWSSGSFHDVSISPFHDAPLAIEVASYHGSAEAGSLTNGYSSYLWVVAFFGGVSVFISGREVVSEYGFSTSCTHVAWNLQIQMCWLWWGVVTMCFNSLQEVTIYSNVSMKAFSGPMGWTGQWVKNRVSSLLRKWEWRKTGSDSLWVRAVATQIFRFQEMYFLKVVLLAGFRSVSCIGHGAVWQSWAGVQDFLCPCGSNHLTHLGVKRISDWKAWCDDKTFIQNLNLKIIKSLASL